MKKYISRHAAFAVFLNGKLVAQFQRGFFQTDDKNIQKVIESTGEFQSGAVQMVAEKKGKEK